jgi:uncharacterized membrane protein YjfL (UPF0719 family)
VIRALPPGVTIGLQRNSTEEETVSSLNLVRWGGIAAIVGGALFVVLALVMASMPRGRVRLQ